MNLNQILITGSSILALTLAQGCSKIKQENQTKEIIGVYENHFITSKGDTLIYVNDRWYLTKNVGIENLMDGGTYSFDINKRPLSDIYLSNPRPAMDKKSFPKNLI